MERDFSWVDQSKYVKSIRYFAGNALTNVYLTKHTQRCFKKGPKYYANLPADGVSDSAALVYNVEPDLWSDWKGSKEKRYMLRSQPKRSITSASVFKYMQRKDHASFKDIEFFQDTRLRVI
jgi:hypothetical protein